jgi:alkylated DNA repair protein (DNA oxidative demethylase)
MRDLVDALPVVSRLELGPGAVVLGGFALGSAAGLEAETEAVASRAAFRRLTTPGGRTMSVAMTNCGALGWVSDRRGYRYEASDPMSGAAWPAMPGSFLGLARAAAGAAGFEGFAPDCCLINRYEPGTALSAHVDHDEADLHSPIVSVSLGAPATFLWGGLTREAPMRRIRLAPGDVVVWGGESRLVYHGVARLAAGSAVRLNLTFRSTGRGAAS